jgi:hypothetical protein
MTPTEISTAIVESARHAESEGEVIAYGSNLIRLSMVNECQRMIQSFSGSIEEVDGSAVHYILKIKREALQQLMEEIKKD